MQHIRNKKGKNFFVRGYILLMKMEEIIWYAFTGININRAWKDDKTWFGQYAGAYIELH
jgi:hypothetical protein